MSAADSLIELFCDRLERLVAIDSPSGGVEQERVSEIVLEWLAPLGATHTWIDEPDNPARSLAVTLTGDGGPAVALIGHPDTVFPDGTVAARPFRREADRCFGPGVADMKGGLVLAAMAMESLAREQQRPFGELRLLVCADEEIRLRAPAGADPARGVEAALVFECARENGDLVSVRKGAVWRTMTLLGRAAHAGADTARGRSAVSALAREILRIEGLADGRPDMTSVVTTVTGGDAANTVPGHARATIDIRSGDPADLHLAEAELDRPGPYDGVTIEVSDRGTWPPMPRAGGLVDAALAHAAELGLKVSEQVSGGVSDGCWTGEWGVPTIDGLGPVGGHDHTPDEWIEVASVPARIELAARVVRTACGVPSRPAAD
ncbi:MAG: M20/M25/M40 family metallo-hydrolase [Gaiellales bacterium]